MFFFIFIIFHLLSKELPSQCLDRRPSPLLHCEGVLLFLISRLAGGLCRAISIRLSLTEYCSIVLYYYLNKRARHIRCAHSQKSVDNNAYTLLALVAGYYASYVCELAFSYPHLLTRLEFLYFFCRSNNII